ncbi:MAG: hypothetical protein ACYSUP_02325 [Planctomycetota bacterium]
MNCFLHRISRILCTLFVLGTMFVFGGCAHIHKESVALNVKVGHSIVDKHRAYLGLLNRYFENRRAQIDKAILQSYLPSYMTNIREELRNAGENPDVFTGAMVSDIVQDVIEKRDQMQSELEKVKGELVDRINGDYLVVVQGNATVTAILQSAVDVRDAGKSAVETVARPFAPRFDLDEFESKFDDFLKDAGDATKATSDLYNSVKPLLTEGGK